MRIATEPVGPLAFDLVEEDSSERLGRVGLPLVSGGSLVRATWTHEQKTHHLLHDLDARSVRIEGTHYIVRPRGTQLEVRDRWRRIGRARIISHRSGALRLELPDGLSARAVASLALLAHIKLGLLRRP